MISVCIATYNGEKYIGQQLNSILSQLTDKDEVIISDDNSDDGTISLIKSLNDNRIKIFINDKNNSGYTNNFQNCILKSKGDSILLCDQDDIWFKNKVERTLSALKTNDFVASDALFVDRNLKSLKQTFFSLRGGWKPFFLSNLYKQKYLGCCLAFNRILLNKILPFPKNSQFATHDLWISLIGTCYYKSKVLNEPLIYYRRHGNNVSGGGAESETSLLFKINYRLYCLYHVFKRFNK